MPRRKPTPLPTFTIVQQPTRTATDRWAVVMHTTMRGPYTHPKASDVVVINPGRVAFETAISMVVALYDLYDVEAA